MYRYTNIYIFPQAPRYPQHLRVGLEAFWVVGARTHVLSWLREEYIEELRVVVHLVGEGFFAVLPSQDLNL